MQRYSLQQAIVTFFAGVPSERTVKRWIKEGHHGVMLPAVKIGRYYLLTETGIRAFLDALRVKEQMETAGLSTRCSVPGKRVRSWDDLVAKHFPKAGEK